MSTTTDKTQRMIFLALPFVFVLFVISFPAGLLVYWITTNLWTIVQQAIVRKRLGPLRPPGPEQESLGDMLKKLAAATRPATEAADGKAAEARSRDASRPARGSEPKGRPSGPPPPPPRRKKKRSGRRR